MWREYDGQGWELDELGFEGSGAGWSRGGVG